MVRNYTLFFLLLAWLPSNVGAMEYYTDFIPYKGRVEITYEIPNDQLQFVTHTNGYITFLNFIAIFEDENGNIIKSDIWKRSYKIENYQETSLLSQSIFGDVSLSIPPGSYRLITRVEGMHSSEVGLNEESVQVPDFNSQSPLISGIKFLKTVKWSNGDSLNTPKTDLTPVVQYYPNPRRTYEEEEDIAFQFEIYSTDTCQLTAIWKIVDCNQKIVFEGKKTIESSEWSPFSVLNRIRSPGRSSPRVGVGLERRTLPHSRTHPPDSDQMESGKFRFHKSQITIHHSQFTKGGDYFLRVQVAEDSDPARGGTTSTATFSLDFSIFYTEENYIERVEKMEYLATPEEMKVLKNAPLEEREKVYQEFWKKHDPTPISERNEFEEEYFRRVEIVNKLFTPPDRGWRSDRGRIYIKFGPPDQVQEQAFSLSTNPYQIWHYFGHNYQFVFVDEHGIGQYTLTNREEEIRADRERR